MIRLLYNLLFPLGLLLVLPAYLRKMARRGGYRLKFGQRFGIYGKEVRARLAGRRNLWLHAVSVGEMLIALKLARKLREALPAAGLVISTTTTTGFALAEKEAPAGTEIIYSPLDWWPIARRALAAIRPEKIVLVEAEVWPNLTALARARGIPLLLVNARLSPRSERRFRRFAFAVRPLFRQLDRIGVTEPEDAARWQALGVAPARIELVGNIKFDTDEVAIDPDLPAGVLRAIGVNADRLVLMGGSTHAGEELILADIFLELRRQLPGLFLLLAPRHVERTRTIVDELAGLGLTVALRDQTEPADPRARDCLLLNTTGELRHWYSAGTVIFVGKSLTAHGGQNPVEPILAGRAVVFGPHMENFASLAELLVRRKAAVQIADRTELQTVLSSLLQDPIARADMVRSGRSVLDAHRGATARTVALITAVQRKNAGE